MKFETGRGSRVVRARAHACLLDLPASWWEQTKFIKLDHEIWWGLLLDLYVVGRRVLSLNLPATDIINNT
jgi:hypothetical protein